MTRKYAALLFLFLLFVAVAAMLERLYFRGFPGYGMAKMGLATGYLVLAVTLGALDSRLGRWLLLGFAFAWWGDFLLIGPGNGFFLAGLVAFLLGHICYCVAFATHGPRWGMAAATYLVLSFPGAALLWKLWPGIPAGLGFPVLLYLVTITLMVALSFACIVRPGGWLLVLGAVLFYLSDMGVSAHAFGDSGMGPFKRLVILYFPGQYLLALAIPLARRSLAKSPCHTVTVGRGVPVGAGKGDVL